MIVGFIIWSLCALALVCIGIYDLRSETPVGFWAGVKPAEVTDVKAYNRAVACLWFVYGIAFELLGLPLLFLKQNSAGFIFSILGTVAISIALMVAYVFIEKKYRK